MEHYFLVCLSEFYYKNRIFDLNNPVNRDNAYYPFYLLQHTFNNSNNPLNTYDYFDKTDEAKYGLIFFDIPRNINRYLNDLNKPEKYLVIWESEITLPINWNIDLHRHFTKIFTWNDDLVDNQKYFKINYSQKIPSFLSFDTSKKTKLCTMIAGNKITSHPLELYSERIKSIRWFEKNHPDDFDLYGIGWDKSYLKGILLPFNIFGPLKKIFGKHFPSYKGSVKSKNETYEKYKFAICYENARDIPGYITEKIFDCFFGGCVPVYWGAPNVTEHIPADTFIDRRNFKTHEELYEYIKNMSEEEYKGYLDAITNFVNSDKIYPYSAEYFAGTLADQILGDK